MKRLAVFLALFALPVAPALADLSLQVEGRGVKHDLGPTSYDAAVGVFLPLGKYAGVRGHLLQPGSPAADVGAEIGFLAILPARLEAMIGVGLMRFEGPDGDTESETFYRAGLFVRAIQLPESAVLIGAGIQRMELESGEDQTDPWLSLGFRGR